MKQVLVMVKDGGCLRPYGDPAWDVFDQIHTTKPIIVTVHQARNPRHHNKIWALAKKVADFSDFTSPEAAMRWVKRRIPSMHRTYRERSGELVIELESISFPAMDQISFNKFYDQALMLWSEKIGADPESLQ